MAELHEKHPANQLVFVSATVYNHSRTFLRCYPSGDGRKEICGWSNLDFNHFSGFATYQVKRVDGVIQQYGLIMGLGNEDTSQRTQRQGKRDITDKRPEIPELPDLEIGGPAFVVTEGDTKDREAMDLIEGMHHLYRVEGKRMEEAYHARIKAYAERKAYLLANPPNPKDITVQFWKRESPSPAGMENLKKGAKP